MSDQKTLEEWLNDAEATLKLAESEPAAHRQHLRVTHTHTHTHRDTYSDTQAFLYKYKYRFTYT